MMKSVLLLLASVVMLNVHAQTGTAKPGPEHRKLQVWVGDWKYKGTVYDTPERKGGRFEGTQKARMILDGFFLQVDWRDKGDYGDNKGNVDIGMDVYGYDPIKRVYTMFGFGGGGGTTTGTLTVEGNTWTQTGSRMTADGKTNQDRYVIVFSEDGKRITVKCEYFADGTKWSPAFDLVMTKVRNAR
jgi:hypothetical protein